MPFLTSFTNFIFNSLPSLRGINSNVSINQHNLKSALTQYVAVAALVGDHGEELELWCTDKDDEKKFLKMFNEHPEML